MSEWIDAWAKKQWRRWVQGRWVEIPNNDLWQILYELRKTHQLEYQKVKGHSGHPENEHCDRLAAKQSEKYDHIVNGNP